MNNEEKAVEGAVYYTESGKETEDAKSALAYYKGASRYVREFKAQLYVKGTIVLRNDRARYKWRKVGENCFNNYLKYLQTNQEYCYNLAERSRSE